MKRTKKFVSGIVLNAILIAVCVSMLVGSTFAWFTDSEASENNVIASGSFDLKATWADGSVEADTAEWKNFADGAIFDYDKWEPGYVSSRYLKIKNDGTVALKFKVLIAPTGKVSELAEVIDVYYVDGANLVSRESLASATPVSTLAELIADVDGAAYGYLTAKQEKTITIALKMRESAGSEYQNMSIGSKFSIKILATQYTEENDSFGSDYDADAQYPVDLPDLWDGTADTTWYNETDTEFSLSTAEQFAGFAKLVGTTDQFEGKTIKLDVDMDLGAFKVDENGELILDESGNPIKVSFEPIGTTGERDSSNRLITETFKGTFDGDGHIISNVYQSGWDFGYEWQKYGSIGLFSELEGATVKNVVLDGFNCQVEGGDVAFIAGSATGTCVFENIEIKNGTIGTYNNGIGSIIGWSGAGEYTFKDITIAEDVVLGGLWGSFDSSIGGVVGQGEPGATYNFENVNVACRLDTYNDVTASYKYYLYRMSGMLIGRLAKTTTIDGNNYPDMSQYNITCKDVTVTYGDWMNYHYCYGIYKRVEAGYAYDGLDVNAEGHADACTEHMVCLPFEGLFGGDQYGVRPITKYEGVTVNYPSSYQPNN